ncbi:hypothetical protein ALC56_03169 [Trachymyrmex septentrionalis]|uniref:Uncharacterized protein n=1 Tax=Trachymyrmex septentrionalis TaxID=34720 RepID=A0A151K0D2_9HYME|nr:hypothetical protein ALC56_03169 [Trachymyrmex septentrionalis]
MESVVKPLPWGFAPQPHLDSPYLTSPKTRLKASRHVAARIERRVTCVDTSTLKRTVDSRCNDLSDAFLGLLATLLRGIIECHLDITNGPSEEETERCAGKDGKHDGFSLHCRKLALWHRRRMGQVTCDSFLINGRTCLTC